MIFIIQTFYKFLLKMIFTIRKLIYNERVLVIMASIDKLKFLMIGNNPIIKDRFLSLKTIEKI